ncbi:MAG: serine hydrolase domain-containing protein [Acidimicrobiia bacterium]
MTALDLVLDWHVDNVAATVIDRAGTTLATTGLVERTFPLASVTKLLTAYTTLIAVEEGSIDLDTPHTIDEAGAVTVRQLLSHSSGMAPLQRLRLSPPQARRIYSNAAFDVVAEIVATATGIDFATYAAEAVFEPLGMTRTALPGPAGSGAVSTVVDLARFATELFAPRLVAVETLHEATTTQFPGLSGVLPAFGRQDPNDWGLGFELRHRKSPHWTGTTNSPDTFGHFGRSGTFLWVDPVAGLAMVCLTDREFGDWAAASWPQVSDAVIAEFALR